MRVLVTGASGFVGSSLVRQLQSRGRFTVVASTRRRSTQVAAAGETVFVGEIDAETDWSGALKGVEVVVHLAARVHAVRDVSPSPLDEFRRVNVGGTLGLARQAAAAGVRRFVLLSSVKVHGEGALGSASSGGSIYRETDTPSPADAYAISKYEAESGAREIATETGMEVVIIRPPLVYGPGVRANFRTLMRAVKLGIPLPFASIANRRSLVGVDNLVSFIIVCMEHPAAANQAFLVSDGEDLSTRELIRRLAAAIGTRARLFPAPPGALVAAATLLGRRGLALRLAGSLQVDIFKARTLLEWKPPVSVDEGLRRLMAIS